MIQRKAAYGCFSEANFLLRDVDEIALRREETKVDGKIWYGHLSFERLAGFLRRFHRIERDPVFLPVQRLEERQSLDVVPMKMSEEEMQIGRLAGSLLHQCGTKRTNACAAIDDDDLASWQPKFEAACIAAIARVLNAGCRNRSAYSPELHQHL